MSLLVVDLTLLVVFLVFIGIFLYKKRHNLKKDGWLVLYRTQWGVKLIDRIGKKYQKSLKVMSYVSVALGYLLMVGMLYLVYTIVEIYLLHPTFVSQIKIPPILPLVPYFTELPGIKGLFPTFYFIHFIIAIVIVATIHEFSHGVFMRRFGIKIKSTGFAFLKWFPAFLGAFVEQDENSMNKAKNFEQRAVLSAGTFSNTLMAILIFLLLALFFLATFHPAGVIFNDYTYTPIALSSITMINGVNVVNPSLGDLGNLSKDASLNEIKTGDKSYLGVKGILDEETILLYDDAPAIKSNLKTPITSIDSVKITSIDKLSDVLGRYSPGDEIEIETKVKGEAQSSRITLGENPYGNGKAWLGIAFFDQESNGIMAKVFGAASSFNKPGIYYESSLGEFGQFIYDLLWWVALINLAVALFNMLPAGGLDGGRFFYLTILSLTGSEKAAIRGYKFMTSLFMFLLLAIMVLWGIALIG